MSTKIQEVESTLNHEELDFFIKVIYSYTNVVVLYIIVTKYLHVSMTESTCLDKIIMEENFHHMIGNVYI